MPRLPVANLGIARSYTLTCTRTAAFVCACALSHGATPAEHVRCTPETEECREYAIGNWRRHVQWAHYALARRFAWEPHLCCSRCELSTLRGSFADLPRLPESTGQTSF